MPPWTVAPSSSDMDRGVKRGVWESGMFLIPASDPALSHSQKTRPEDTARGALRQRRKGRHASWDLWILKPFESPSDKFIFEGENKQDREFNAGLNTQCPSHHPQPPQDDGACGFLPLQLSKPCHFYPQGTVFSIIISLFWLFLDESCSPSVSG